jgi:hypothetical protein
VGGGYILVIKDAQSNKSTMTRVIESQKRVGCGMRVLGALLDGTYDQGEKK